MGKNLLSGGGMEIKVIKKIVFVSLLLIILIVLLFFIYPKDNQLKTNFTKSNMQFNEMVEFTEKKVIDLTSSFDLLEINKFLQIHANSNDYYYQAISFLEDTTNNELQKSIVIYSMQSLNKKQYWQFLENCSILFCKKKLSEEEIKIVIFTGYEWSNLTVVNFYSSSVRKPLKRIEKSEYSSKELKDLVRRILSGKVLIDYWLWMYK